MARITGRIEVLLNGRTLLNKPGWTASGIGISGQMAIKRKEVLGDTGLHGTVEEPIVAKAEGKLTDRDDFLLGDFALVRENGTVIFRSAGGGKVYTMNNATCLCDFTVTGGEGEVNVAFIGPFWTETTEAAS